MNIVGIDIADRDETHVHTIDMWFSQKRGAWCVERLNAHGDVLGGVHECASEDDARDCLDHWLRAHGETHLVSPPAAKRAKSLSRPRARAA